MIGKLWIALIVVGLISGQVSCSPRSTDFQVGGHVKTAGGGLAQTFGGSAQEGGRQGAQAWGLKRTKHQGSDAIGDGFSRIHGWGHVHQGGHAQADTYNGEGTTHAIVDQSTLQTTDGGDAAATVDAISGGRMVFGETASIEDARLTGVGNGISFSLGAASAVESENASFLSDLPSYPALPLFFGPRYTIIG